MTGEAPDDATERLREDPLVPASKRYKGKASASLLGAIGRALRVDEGERPQSIKVWRSELEGSVDTSGKNISERGDKVVAKVDEQDEFKDPTGLTKWTTIFLYAQLVMAIVTIFSNMLEYQLLTDFMSDFYQSQSDAALFVANYAAQANYERQNILKIIDAVICNLWNFDTYVDISSKL